MNYHTHQTIDAFAGIPQPVRDGIADVTIAWSRLDYALRIALKRIGWKNNKGKEIRNIRNHTGVIKALESSLEHEKRLNDEEKDTIRKLLRACCGIAA